ncbi:hypothetical protein D917_07413, partial [Trichinella nativa]
MNTTKRVTDKCSLKSNETLQGQLLCFSLIIIFTPIYASYVTVILSVR